MRREADQYWFNLKDKAKWRAIQKSYGCCEYCQLRPWKDLHHRNYDREGAEQLEDVMLVCRICHQLIHGLISSLPGFNEVKVRVGSIAHKGDRGLDPWSKSKQWVEYLNSPSNLR